MRERGVVIGLKKLFFFITLIFVGTLALLSFAVWQTARNKELKGHRQFVESVLRVVREPIVARDQIAIERALQAFHEEGRHFRLSLPGNFEIIWPREFFSPVWNTKPDYKTTVKVGEDQALTVEYWAAHGHDADAWPMFALAFSFLLAVASIVGLWFHLRRWQLDVARIEGYLANPKGASDFDLFHYDFFRGLAVQIREMESEREKRFETEKNSEKLKELANQAAQVAHDIRSPLAALDAFLNTVASLSEDSRNIVYGAVGRIHDIANGLLQRNREYHAGGAVPQGSDNASEQLLSSLANALVTEKRMQYRAKIGVEISGASGETSYGLFAALHPVEFKRALSNLIDNSVESLGDKGAVAVDITAVSGRIRVSVKDNGRGIPAEVLGKIGRLGETYDKPGGSGIGLHSAKAAVESWGGRLDINSTVGRGTEVTFSLPRADAPAWFISELKVAPGSSVVVLDDDASIHQIWKERFGSISPRPELFHFSTPAEFSGWIRGRRRAAKNTLYLIDYELRAPVSGLELVEEFGIGSSGVLVTSRFGEKRILDECLRLKVRMIPKGSAGFVPISLSADSSPDAILIDDDPLVQKVWKMAARAHGKNLLVFSGAEEFLKADSLDRTVALYVDSDLGEGERGEQFAEKFLAAGFKNIYLATGTPAESFARMPWIKKVVGKEPPWA